MAALKLKKLVLSLEIIFFSIGLPGLAAQSMFLKVMNGSQTGYNLSEISKLSFNSGSILVNTLDGHADSFNLSDLRYLNFVNLNTGVDIEKRSIPNVFWQLYPNPVYDVLNLYGVFREYETTIFQIISIQGRMVFNEKRSGSANTEQINVSSLPAGVYLCMIINGNTLTTLRFLKK